MSILIGNKINQYKIPIACSFLIGLLDNLQLGDISARGFFKYQLSVQCLNKLSQGFQSGEVDKVLFEKGSYFKKAMP